MSGEEIFHRRTVAVNFSVCLGKFFSPGHLVEKPILLVSNEVIIHKLHRHKKYIYHFVKFCDNSI